MRRLSSPHEFCINQLPGCGYIFVQVDVEKDVAEIGVCSDQQLRLPGVQRFEVEHPDPLLHVLFILLVKEFASLGIQCIFFNHLKQNNVNTLISNQFFAFVSWRVGVQSQR